MKPEGVNSDAASPIVGIFVVARVHTTLVHINPGAVFWRRMIAGSRAMFRRTLEATFTHPTPTTCGETSHETLSSNNFSITTGTLTQPTHTPISIIGGTRQNSQESKRGISDEVNKGRHARIPFHLKAS